MMPSSISSTCEQNSSSVNNNSSIPSSCVSSETRPRRYSRTVSSFLKDEPITLAAPNWSVITERYVTDVLSPYIPGRKSSIFACSASRACARRSVSFLGLRRFAGGVQSSYALLLKNNQAGDPGRQARIFQGIYPDILWRNSARPEPLRQLSPRQYPDEFALFATILDRHSWRSRNNTRSCFRSFLRSSSRLRG